MLLVDVTDRSLPNLMWESVNWGEMQSCTSKCRRCKYFKFF